MPDARISELTQAPDLEDVDEFALASAGASERLNAAALRQYLGRTSRLTMTGAKRLVSGGTNRLELTGPSTAMHGAYATGSLTVQNDEWFLQYKRWRLDGTARSTLVGNADVFIFDLAPVGRITLAGRGT